MAYVSPEVAHAMTVRTKQVCRPPEKRAHPAVHFLWAQLRIENMTRDELERRAGMSQGALYWWWYPSRQPRKGKVHKGGIMLHNLEAALGVFGYTLKPTPKRED